MSQTVYLHFTWYFEIGFLCLLTHCVNPSLITILLYKIICDLSNSGKFEWHFQRWMSPASIPKKVSLLRRFLQFQPVTKSNHPWRFKLHEQYQRIIWYMMTMMTKMLGVWITHSYLFFNRSTYSQCSNQSEKNKLWFCNTISLGTKYQRLEQMNSLH